MKMMLDLDIKRPENTIHYNEQLLLMGSCFTQHIGKKLQDVKFKILQNPSGILFDPLSVVRSLNAYIENKPHTPEDLFYLNELWQSWNHHSDFSGMDATEVLINLDKVQQEAHDFLKNADWLIITLGSSFIYKLVEGNQAVANCHRAPAKQFYKHLLSTREIEDAIKNCIDRLYQFNHKLKIIFTISPVRHIRDGVVENNRSKARLIEAVHNLLLHTKSLFYFPAYELVIDVLRDYRFYDIDLVHPNYAATEFVFQKFTEIFIDDEAQALMEEVKKIMIAYRHKPFQSSTKAHQRFLEGFLMKVKQYQHKYPQINFEKELLYFSGHQ